LEAADSPHTIYPAHQSYPHQVAKSLFSLPGNGDASDGEPVHYLTTSGLPGHNPDGSSHGYITLKTIHPNSPGTRYL